MSIQRYGRYAIDKVCLPSGNVPVHNIARIGVSPRGRSTHFRHHQIHIRTESLDSRRHRSRTPRTLELGRRTRYLTLEFSSSIGDRGRLRSCFTYMRPARYYGAHLRCGSITGVISHFTSSSKPSIGILLSSTDFSRMSVRQSLPHNTYEETRRKSGYCDQET